MVTRMATSKEVLGGIRAESMVDTLNIIPVWGDINATWYSKYGLDTRKDDKLRFSRTFCSVRCFFNWKSEGPYVDNY